VKLIMKVAGVGLAFALLAGVMAYLAGFFEEKIPDRSVGIVSSKDSGSTYTVQLSREVLTEQAAGTLRAKIETVISPLITAAVSSIAVRPGDEVKEGDVLVKLDSRELKARLDQAHQGVAAAKAGFEQAEKDYQRVQRIYKADPGAISKAELDRIGAAMETARADLMRLQRQEDEVKTAFGFSTISAPISGRIVNRYADPGDTARKGEPLLGMYDPGSLRLEASVRESVASSLSKAQELIAEVDAVNRRFDGVVDEIVPSADPGSRSFIVKVRLKGEYSLYPGMFGRLLIPTGHIEKMYIPEKAVTNVGQLDFVMVKSHQGPTRRFVRLGGRKGEDRIEVISGLSPGDIIFVR